VRRDHFPLLNYTVTLKRSRTTKDRHRPRLKELQGSAVEGNFSSRGPRAIVDLVLLVLRKCRPVLQGRAFYTF
jgi:hypothetical protein